MTPNEIIFISGAYLSLEIAVMSALYQVIMRIFDATSAGEGGEE